MIDEKKAQEMYERYIDNVLGYIQKTKVNGKAPDETFMRGLEACIDIGEVHADDFRRSVACKWAATIHALMPKPNFTFMAQRPCWKDDWAMKDAITLSIKNAKTAAPTFHLGEREFADGQLVMFNTTCDLEYYQEREEEVRSRRVEKYTKGRIYCAIARSTCWYYAVKIEGTVIVEAPHTILRDKSWYDEEARRFNETDTYMDSEAASIAAGGGDYLRAVCLSEETLKNFDQVSAEMMKEAPKYPHWQWGVEYEELVRNFDKCICSMNTLMSTGCKCGHLEKHENSRQ